MCVCVHECVLCVMCVCYVHSVMCVLCVRVMCVCGMCVCVCYVWFMFVVCMLAMCICVQCVLFCIGLLYGCSILLVAVRNPPPPPQMGLHLTILLSIYRSSTSQTSRSSLPSPRRRTWRSGRSCTSRERQG